MIMAVMYCDEAARAVTSHGRDMHISPCSSLSGAHGKLELAMCYEIYRDLGLG